jgi:hypothetical protein
MEKLINRSQDHREETVLNLKAMINHHFRKTIMDKVGLLYSVFVYKPFKSM